MSAEPGSTPWKVDPASAPVQPTAREWSAPEVRHITIYGYIIWSYHHIWAYPMVISPYMGMERTGAGAGFVTGVVGGACGAKMKRGYNTWSHGHIWV